MLELDCDDFDDVRFDDDDDNDNGAEDKDAEDEDHDKPSIPLKSNLNSEFMIGLD